jgi:hypothetical protein
LFKNNAKSRTAFYFNRRRMVRNNLNFNLDIDISFVFQKEGARNQPKAKHNQALNRKNGTAP